MFMFTLEICEIVIESATIVAILESLRRQRTVRTVPIASSIEMRITVFAKRSNVVFPLCIRRALR